MRARLVNHRKNLVGASPTWVATTDVAAPSGVGAMAKAAETREDMVDLDVSRLEEFGAAMARANSVLL